MKGSNIMTANAKNAKSAAEKLVEEAAEAGLVETETTVPSQSNTRVESKRDTEGKLHIRVSEDEDTTFQGAKVHKEITEQLEDGVVAHVALVDGEIVITAVEPGKAKKLVAGLKDKVKRNKKAVLAGAIAGLAIAIGVSVQKNRTTTDEESEAEVVETTDEA